ncbi:hypothetical protein PENTCL1PPCAC_28817, partial [Pristionchus entomophagus]
ITNAAKKTEIKKIITNQETAYTTWSDDQWAWIDITLLLALCCLIRLISAKRILYNSKLCVLLPASSTAAKNKYKTLVDNLSKDKTLKAQKDRVKNWLNNNFKETGLTKKQVPDKLVTVQEVLTSRSRSIAYINGLFAKIIVIAQGMSDLHEKKKLWERDAEAKNHMRKAYSNWLGDVDEIVPKAKLAQVQKIIADYDTADQKKEPKDFFSDGNAWLIPMGF